MNKLLPLLLVFGLVFFIGCTLSPTQNITNESNDIRLNCRELGGYLCSWEGECALEWLNSSDSYCCPIKCGTCPASINCDDINSCTEDRCTVENGKTVCKHSTLTPCANNGICEYGEIETCGFNGYSGNLTGPILCCPGNTHAVSAKTIESYDCPTNCDDNNSNTADYYNFDTQRCEHYNCF